MKVKCEICGKEFHQITTSHLQTHNISFDEYKILYPNSKLISDKLHEKRIEINSGKNNPFFGKYHSEESRKLIKDNHSQIKGEDHPLFNKFVSNETRQKMRDNHADISGLNNPFYGKHHSLESRIKNSCSSQNIDRGDFNGFTKRNHVKSINQCIKLNSYFKGSNFHHIMSGVGVYIPKELHQSIIHNMKNRNNMNEINKITLQYLMN